MRTKILVLLVLFCTSTNALAAWGTPVRITGYFIYDIGLAYFTTDGNQNPSNCQDPRYIALDTGSANFKAIWAQLISAYTTGNTVSVNYVDCMGLYPKAIALAIPQVW